MLRIGGIASGIDTDAMITQLMNAHRIPVDRLVQQRTILEWQRDAYREMNTMLTDYRNNKLSEFRLETTFLARQVSITGDASAVSAKANPNVQGSNLSIKVTSLATSASKWSDGDIRSSSADFDTTQSLADQVDHLNRGEFTKQEYTILINGTEVNIDVENDSLDSIIARINRDTNVNAFFDEITGQLSFRAKETGLVQGAAQNSAYIEFVDDDNFLSETFRINVGANTAGNSIAATNAEVTINGMQTERASNTFSVNGIEVTLLKATDMEANIEVVRDTDRIYDAVVKFVTEYNELLDKLNAKISEERHRDYPPLTQEQKNAMTDREIDQWEEAARSGMLRNDSILSNAISNMRLTIAKSVEVGDNEFMSLSSLGITSGNYTERGKLYINEAKLRAAIEADPDAVTTLFTKKSSGEESTPSNSYVLDQGIAASLHDQLKETLDAIVEKAGSPLMQVNNSFIGKSLERMNDRIDMANRRLDMLEDRYYRQFTAMEKAMQMLTAQSASLASMFNMGQY